MEFARRARLLAWLWLLAAALSSSSQLSQAAQGWRMIHKFSDEARELGLLPKSWPARGSLDYHLAAHRHDMHRHGRRLAVDQTLVLLRGNYTEDLGPSFGGIHYSIVDIGTPNVSFLVALDTGSDLFWVPCDCQQCETAEFPELRIDLSTFNSKLSSSSASVPCSDELCESRGKLCTSGSSACPYEVNYLSANTSTSGKLLRDVIYLRKASSGETIKAPIVFGCGEVQTGLFLHGGAPNGLLGLGPGALSLPSLIANDGLIRDSFSMCFDDDGSGRLLFGDQGAGQQRTTPFLSDQQPAYFVGVEQIRVGNLSTESSKAFRALIDTGTTLTYLPPEVYAAVTEAFSRQVPQLNRLQNADLDPYEFCYSFKGQEGDIPGPQISLTFRGGADYVVKDPFLYLMNGRNEKEIIGICLAILKGSIPIIGQNFMVGYKLTFDREQSRLGWIQADCYSPQQSAQFPVPQANPGFKQGSSENDDDTSSPFVDPERGRVVVARGAAPTFVPSFTVLLLLLLLRV